MWPQLIMTAVGMLMQRGQQQQAQALLEQSMDAYKNQDLPKLQSIVAQVLPPSAMAQVQADAGDVAAQKETIGSYNDIIGGNGLAAEDQAAMNRVGNEVDRRGRGARAAITQRMQAAGTTGGGQDIAAQLAEGQDANQQLNQAGLDEKSLALKNRLAAVAGKGSLASQMRGESFSEDSAKAAATDTVNQLNAQFRQSADQYNSQLPQETYQDALQKIAGETGATSSLANFHNELGNQQASQMAGAGQAAYHAQQAGSADEQNQALLDYLRSKRNNGSYDASGSSPSDWQSPY